MSITGTAQAGKSLFVRSIQPAPERLRKQFHLSEVYTPEMVVDGASEFVEATPVRPQPHRRGRWHKSAVQIRLSVVTRKLSGSKSRRAPREPRRDDSNGAAGQIAIKRPAAWLSNRRCRASRQDVGQQGSCPQDRQRLQNLTDGQPQTRSRYCFGRGTTLPRCQAEAGQKTPRMMEKYRRSPEHQRQQTVQTTSAPSGRVRKARLRGIRVRTMGGAALDDTSTSVVSL